MYTLLFDKDFKRDVDKLDNPVGERIFKKVKDLKKNPELGKHLVGVDLWSLRVGKYRVLYKILKDKLQVIVLTVSHRKDSYRNL